LAERAGEPGISRGLAIEALILCKGCEIASIEARPRPVARTDAGTMHRSLILKDFYFSVISHRSIADQRQRIRGGMNEGLRSIMACGLRHDCDRSKKCRGSSRAD
jgi:hypothetical protein